MTNDEFLAAVFEARPPNGRIFTVSFPGDPAKGDYNFNPFLIPTNNNFFCISTLSTDRRLPQNFVSLHALVVDDVGTKVDINKAVGILGDPSYAIETSEKNLQLGYLLDPPTLERPVAEGLVEGLCKVFGDDMRGINRLARLPVGQNGKPIRNNFPTRLLHFEHKIVYTPDDMMTRLEAHPVDPATLSSKPFLPPDRDPVIAALYSHDLSPLPTRDPGVYKITCPWVHEHTGGRNDGTAYLAPAGFRCWHGHCAGKTFADLRRHLDITATTIDDAIVEAALGINPPIAVVSGFAEFDAGKGSTQTEWKLYGDPPPTPRVHPWAAQTVRDLFTADGQLLPKSERDRLYPRHWLFNELIPMSTPWAIAGEGGLGKSRLGLALCMSVATGIPLGDYFVPDPEPHPTLFLTQEDDACDRAHRFATQYELLCERDHRWRASRVADALTRNLYIPTLRFGQQLDDRFISSVGDFASQCGPLRLVLFDPLVLFWDHEDEQHSINSAAGVISTFKKLIQIARQHSEHGMWSCGMMHHMNKTGKEFYGSVMIHSHVRTLFTLTRTENPPDDSAKYVDLTVAKSNSTNKADKTYLFELDKETAAIYPKDNFVWETNEDKLAAMVHELGGGTATDIQKAAADRRIDDAKSIIGRWRGQPDRAKKYGIWFGKYNRIETAMEGEG